MIKSCLRNATLREWMAPPHQEQTYRYQVDSESDSESSSEEECALQEVIIQIQEGHRVNLSIIFEDETSEEVSFSLLEEKREKIVPSFILFETILQKKMILIYKEITHGSIFCIYILYALQRGIQEPLSSLLQHTLCIFLLHITLIYGIFHQI